MTCDVRREVFFFFSLLSMDHAIPSFTRHVQTKYFAIQMSQVRILIPYSARDFYRDGFFPLFTLVQVYAGSWPPLHWSDADGLLIHMHVPHRKVMTHKAGILFSIHFASCCCSAKKDVSLFMIARDFNF